MASAAPTGAEADRVVGAGSNHRMVVGRLGDYVALTKPRIMALLLVTAYCAMVVANQGLPAFGITSTTLVGLACSVGGAHAFNMWYDRDIDAIMERTRRRPIPAGRMTANHAIWMGVGLELLAVGILWRGANLLTAGLAFSGFVYYVGIYTLWLKRRTPQNIVVGGGAGAMPPLVGWAAVNGHLAVAPLLMFLMVFLWTPPHFWALALYRNQDYRRAGVPMMPVVNGERTTKRQMLVYALMLLASTVGLYFTGTVGGVYLTVASLVGILFVMACVMAFRESLPHTLWAKRTFMASLMYLTAVFGVMVVNVLLPH